MDGHGKLQMGTIMAVLELTNLLLIQIHETSLKNHNEIELLSEFILKVYDADP